MQGNPNIGKYAAMGGKASAKALTKKERRDKSRRAAIIRWTREAVKKSVDK